MTTIVEDPAETADGEVPHRRVTAEIPRAVVVVAIRPEEAEAHPRADGVLLRWTRKNKEGFRLKVEGRLIAEGTAAGVIVEEAEAVVDVAAAAETRVAAEVAPGREISVYSKG
jgi:hypothetical protein